MVSTTGRYVIRFAVHLTSVYRENYLAELAENTGADARELPDGTIEITGFRAKNDYWVFDALKQEERRGALVIEHCSR
jgi:hypothetical protein